MSAEPPAVQIARLEERLNTVVRDMESQNEQIAAIRGQLDQVLTALGEARGGWKTLMWLGGAAATFGGFMSWALTHVEVK